MLWQLGELEAAERELTTAIELRTRLGDPRALAEGYNDRAVVLSLTHVSAALDDLIRARELAEPLGRPDLLSEILHNIAYVHWAGKDYERALDLFRESERVAPRGRISPRDAAITSDTIGGVLFDLRRYDEAEAQFHRAMLLEDQRPAAALRQAQRKLLATRALGGPESRAAFVLQGDWQAPPVRQGETSGARSP